MKIPRFFISEKRILAILISILVLQAVLSGSLFKYSDYSSFSTLVRRLSQVARLLIIFIGCHHFLNSENKKKDIIPLLMYVLIVFISRAFTHSALLFDSLFVSFVFRDVFKRDQVINLFLYSITGSFLIVVMSYFAGMLPEYIVTRKDGRERMSLGFAHPNTLGYYVMIICFLLVLRRKGKIKVVHMGVLFLAFCFIHIFPNSNSSAISVLLFSAYLIVSSLYDRFSNKKLINNKLFRILVLSVIPICLLIIAYYVIRAFDYTHIEDATRNFYSRMKMGSEAISNSGMDLFRLKEVEFSGTAARYFGVSSKRYFVVDSLYLYALVAFGLIPSIFFLFYYIICEVKAMNAEDTDILVLFAIMALYSVNESMMLAAPASFLYIIASGYRQKYKILNIVNATKC